MSIKLKQISIVLAFTSGVELFDYVVDGEGWRGICESLAGGGQMGDMASRWGGIKPLGCRG